MSLCYNRGDHLAGTLQAGFSKDRPQGASCPGRVTHPLPDVIRERGLPTRQQGQFGYVGGTGSHPYGVNIPFGKVRPCLVGEEGGKQIDLLPMEKGHIQDPMLEGALSIYRVSWPIAGLSFAGIAISQRVGSYDYVL